MKKFIFILGFYIVFPLISSAQIRLIKGRIVDKDDVPVEYAAVVLQKVDSTYLCSAVSDSLGYFRLSVNVSSFRLIVQHLLYRTYEHQYSGVDSMTIVLAEKENVMQEVVVKEERSAVHLVDGKITYDMPRLLSGKVVSNIYDAVLQLPGVREQSGVLVLAGATSVTVLINGQKSSMPEENLAATLKSLPYSQLSKAEIMYSTPPQYHIRGAAINIVLKDHHLSNGIQGEMNMGYTQKYYGEHMGGVSVSVPTKRWTTDFNYSYRSNHSKNDLNLYSHHLYQNDVYEIQQLNSGDRKVDEHDVRVGINYEASNKNKINVVYTSQIFAGVRSNETSIGTYSDSKICKTDEMPTQMHNMLFSFLFGSGFKTGMEYTYYKDNNSQHLVENKIDKENDFIAHSMQIINRYRFFVDRTCSSGNNWTFNYGVQYTYVVDHSSQIYHSNVGEDMSSSDMDSKIREHAADSYVGFEKTFNDRFSLSGSLTGEYYKMSDIDEWTIFPAFNMTYMISSLHVLQLSLSSDKVYPDYWVLHGGKSYINGYAVLYGNPYLKPYREYNAQLNCLWKSKYILTVYYNYIDKYYVQLPYQSTDELALIYQTLNFDYKKTAGINLILPVKIGRLWNVRLTVNGFYDKVKSTHFHNLAFDNGKFSFYALLENTFSLSSKPDIKLECSGASLTPSIQGPGDLSRIWCINAGVKYVFWHNAAELRLKGTDFFDSWMPDMNLHYSSQNLKMDIPADTRNITLSFVWRIGNYKQSKKKIDTSRFGTE